jgi:hypothetical protein
MKGKRKATARDVGVALLSALNDRDHRVLLAFHCDDVVIEVASQVSASSPTVASQANLIGILEGPWKRWTLAPGSVHTDGAVAIIGFLAEGSSAAGVSGTRDGVLGVLVVDGSLRAMSFSIDDVLPELSFDG